MSWHSDAERLDWLVANFASFGSLTRSDVQARPNGLPPVVISQRAVFVRVPCRVMYEWHCFDGATPREALDAAMDAPRCAEGEPGHCTASHRLWQPIPWRRDMTALDVAENGE